MNKYKTDAGGISLTILIFSFLFLIQPVLANMTESFEPTYNPLVEVKKTLGKIDIDGNLNDAGWTHASFANNFVERFPGDNLKPDVETQVMITYDQDKLYVAFICKDNPSDIRATMCQRDQFHSDDAVSVLIDTYGDAT